MPAQSPTRALVTRGLSLVLLFGGIALVSAMTDNDGVREVIPYFVILIFLQFLPITWDPDADIFSPPALTGVLAALSTVSTLASYLVNNQVQLDMVGGLNSEEAAALAVKCLMASALGLVLYYVGYYSGLGRGLKRRFPQVAGIEWDRRRLMAVVWVCLGVFAAIYVQFWLLTGTALFDPSQLSAARALLHDSANSWMFRGIQLGFLPALLLVTLALEKRTTRSQLLAGALLAGLALLVSRTGMRGIFMNVLLVALMLFHYLRRRIPAPLFAVLLLAAVTISNVIYTYRTSYLYNANHDIDVGAQIASPLETLAAHDAERQKLSVLALLMSEFPEHHEFLLGRSWLGVLAAPIPRWVWPEKAEHFQWRDTMIVNNLGGGPFPTPYLGLLYVNFSWLGIVLGMFLWGILQRAMYEWLRQSPRDKNVVLMYALSLLFFGITLSQVDSMLQYLVPMWLVLLFMKKRPSRVSLPA